MNVIASPTDDARSWLDAVRSCVITTDQRGRITYANAAAQLLLEEPIISTPIGNHLLCDGEPMGLPLAPSKDAPSSEFHLARSGPTVQVDVEVQSRTLLDLPVGEAGFVVVVHTTNAEHQREIRKFERLAAMGTMVAGFAHEVLNPVASLRSLTESLDEELVDAGMRLPHIGRMLRVLERVERLVRTSLQFGRPDPPRLSQHRPWALLANALTLIGPRLRTMGADIRVEVDPDLPDVRVDDAQITQVLVIFLNNALDATLAPRKVAMRARRDPAVERAPLRLEVENEGPGISREDLPRIFDPFFTTKATGTGLGLPIAQQLVNENGARLEVVTSPDGPTRFSVIAPVE